MRVLEFLLALFFPNSCIVCSLPGKSICQNCFSKIPVRAQSENNITFFYNFNHPTINKLLWRLKYHHTHDIAEILGEQVAHFLKDKNNILFAPIPLSTFDKRIHNHTYILAKNISDYLIDQGSQNIEVVNDIFVKNNRRKQAHTKSRAERFENMENSFTFNKKYSDLDTSNKTIILFDDVFTTGATLKYAGICLKNSLDIKESSLKYITLAH